MTTLATFARLCVRDLDAGLQLLAASGITEVRLRFGHPTGLQLALVGDVLVLAGDDATLAPFRATDVTAIVEDLDAVLARAAAAGAELVRPVAAQAVGRNATVRFPSGPVVEYVEWDEATKVAAGLSGPGAPPA